MMCQIITYNHREDIDMIVTCEHCKVNKGEEEDMTYKFVPILLCDDCYTGIRYWIADELDIHVQGVDI